MFLKSMKSRKDFNTQDVNLRIQPEIRLQNIHMEEINGVECIANDVWSRAVNCYAAASVLFWYHKYKILK